MKLWCRRQRCVTLWMAATRMRAIRGCWIPVHDVFAIRARHCARRGNVRRLLVSSLSQVQANAARHVPPNRGLLIMQEPRSVNEIFSA